MQINVNKITDNIYFDTGRNYLKIDHNSNFPLQTSMWSLMVGNSNSPEKYNSKYLQNQ